jgi:DNA helicase-2/ATP-dependent DNA helicase PcrA
LQEIDVAPPNKTSLREQRTIIQHQHGPLLVTAGPGCGKSTALLARIRFLILSRKVKPEQILVLTFNEKTEQDLKRRLESMLGIQATAVEIRTYHAFGLKLIRQHYSILGFSKEPQVLPKITNLLEWQKRRQNLVDFEDMLIMPLRLVRRYPETFQKAIASYRHLLVDELQDINERQATLLRKLVKSPSMESAVFVGDRKQSIYAFRGALPEHWLRIEGIPNLKISPLSQTHRLPKSSLALVNGVGAEICDDPPLRSERVAGGRPQWRTFATSDDQADFIAKEVRRLLQHGVPAHEIACLARHRQNLGRLSQALAQRGIGSCELYRDQHDLEPVRKLIQLLRLVKDLRQAGTSVQKKAAVFARRRRSLEQLLQWFQVPPKTVGQICRQFATRGLEAIQVKKKPNEAFYRQVLAFRKALSEAIDCAEPERAAQLLIDTLRGFIGRRDPKLLDFYLKDLSEVKLKIRLYPNWQALSFKPLHPQDQEPTAAIQLMTAHGAKGKEWQYVFVIDCVEGHYPSCYVKTQKGIEEERRVFYVSITRHTEQLYLLQAPFPRQDTKYHTNSQRRNGLVYAQVSPFLTGHKSALDIFPQATGR